MTLQMNKMSLITMGFKSVAEYKYFEKHRDGSWYVNTVECFQNGNECVIKFYDNITRKSYTLYFDSKEKTNCKVKHLISMGYKRVRTK